jgi:hypothetical protein
MRRFVLLTLLTVLTTGSQSGQRRDRAYQEPDPPRVSPGHAFYFTRAIYTGYRWGWGGRPSWTTDYPKADRQFLVGVRRLTGIDAFEYENPISLDDPALRRFPFVYAVEVGHMALTDSEVVGLRNYLLAGGFLMVDDFWGTREWANFESEMRRVFPEYPIVELPMDHPLLDTFYRIDTILQVPNVRQGRWGGPTWEQDGYVPHLRGIFDDAGRLMVLISWNSDLGDAWEWAEDPYYPLPASNFAYRLGVNAILYGMSR